MANLEKFVKYMTVDSHSVPGWIGDSLYKSVGVFAEFQNNHGVVGNAMEIGVYKGRFAIGISWLLRSGEVFSALDIFDEQWMNVDKSGVGASKSDFQRYWDKYANKEIRLSTHQVDTLSLNTLDAERILANDGPFRLISVDGGHTSEHVINDVKLSIRYMAKGGIIMVDDYLNPSWPGVHEGFCQFMHSDRPSVRPFCFHENKLFLCSISYGESYLSEAKRCFPVQGRTKVVSMFGYDTLVI